MIYLISGVPGSGKSTTAKALVQQFNKGFLIETDELRLCVKSGYADPHNWTVETEKQFELAAYNTCDIARNAEEYGFDVVIDDTVSVEQEKVYVKELPKAIRVFLCPDISTIIERGRSRDKKVSEVLIQDVYEHLQYRKNASQTWVSIDNSARNVEDVVKEILSL